MVHTYRMMCLFPLNAHQLNPPTVVSRCCNPCLSFVCTLLYTGSSVLQINESPVCSLDMVPQALACDWLLACLQVTFPVLQPSPINNQLNVIDSVNQTDRTFLFSKECVLSRSHFKSCVIDGASAIFDLLLCVFCDQTGSC